MVCLVALLGADADFFVGSGKLVKLEFRQILYIDHFVLCFVHRMDQLVQLQMNRSCVTILRILDQEDHEKCDDRCAGINNQLPGIGVVEDRSGNSPSHDDADGSRKGPARAQIMRASASKPGEPVGTVNGSFATFTVTVAVFIEPSVLWLVLLQILDQLPGSLSPLLWRQAQACEEWRRDEWLP